MLEQYISVFAAHKLAVAIFVLQLAIRPVTKYTGHRPDDEDLVPWVRRYRNLPDLPRGIIDGVLLTFSSLLAEWYILAVALPRLSGGIVSTVLGLIPIAIGMGLGLSIGKAITETDYTWIEP